MQDWYDHGQPSVFWISGFYFTPCFTTAALQNYARKHKLPIDTVGWNFVMLDMDPSLYTTPPDEGIYINGLYLEGCGWDSGFKQLCESRPKVLFEAAPVMWLQPKPMDEISPPPGYSCPVYRTAERRGVLATTGHSTNFLMTIHMPSNKPEWHWILSGVCLLCSLTSE
ncbi:dynein heavy chain domain-containing protein, partial [Dunaliella salina]